MGFLPPVESRPEGVRALLSSAVVQALGNFFGQEWDVTLG